MPNFYDLKALNDAKQAGANETEQNNEPQFDFSRPLTNAERNNMFRNYTVNRQEVLDSIPDEVRVDYATDRIARRVPFDEWIEDPVDMTAHAQSDAGKLVNGIVKFLPYYGATLFDNTAGSVDALLHMGKDAVDGDGEFHASRSLINNLVSRAMQDFRNWSDEVLPNKRTTEEMEDEDWWNHINANFIGDTLIKNLGFSAGAGTGGAVWAAAGRRALGAATRSAYRTAAASMLGEKSATDALKRVAHGAFLKNPKRAAAEMNAVAGSRNKYAATSMLIGSVAGAGGEARMEALSVADELRAPLMQEAQDRFDKARSELAVSLINDSRYSDGENLNNEGMQLWIDGVSQLKDEYKNEVDTINYEAGRAAVNTYYPNMAVLSLSNAIMFGKMFSGGYKTHGKNNVSGNMKKGFKSKTGAFHTALDAVSLLKTPLSEGWEEMSQKIISDASSNYARHKMGDFHNKSYENKASKDVAEYIMHFGDSAMNTLSDKMSWQEFTVGALTGALGMASTPTYNSNTKSLDFSSMFKNWNGGIYGAIKDIKERRKQSRDIAEKLNARLDDPDFVEYYKGLVRHANLEYEKEQALDDNDKYIWQNKDFEQLLSDIIMFDKVGRLDEFKATVKAFANISNEDAQKIAELFDSDGQFNDAKLADMKKRLNKQAKKVSNMIDDYSAMYNAIDYLSLGTSDPIVIEELMYTSMQLKNFEDRYQDLANNVIDRLVPTLKQVSMEVDKNGNPTKSAEMASELLTNREAIVSLFGGLGVDHSRQGNSIYDFFAAQDKQYQDNVMGWLDAIGALDVDANMKKDAADLQKLIKSRNSFYNTLFDPTFRYKAAPKRSSRDSSQQSQDGGSSESGSTSDQGDGWQGGSSTKSDGKRKIVGFDVDGNPIFADELNGSGNGNNSDTEGDNGVDDNGTDNSNDSSSSDSAVSNEDGNSDVSNNEEGNSDSNNEGGNNSSSALDGLDDEAKKRVTDAIDKLSKATSLGDFANVHDEVMKTLRDNAEVNAFHTLILENAALNAKYKAVMAISGRVGDILDAVNARNDIAAITFLDAADRENGYRGLFDSCEGKNDIGRSVCDYVYSHLPNDEDSVAVQNAIIDALNEHLGKDAYKLRGDNGKAMTDEEAAEGHVEEERQKKINEAIEKLKNAKSLVEFSDELNYLLFNLDVSGEDVSMAIIGDKVAKERYDARVIPIQIIDELLNTLASKKRSKDEDIAYDILVLNVDSIKKIYELYDNEVRNGNPHPNISDITYDYIASLFPVDEAYNGAYNIVADIINWMEKAERFSKRAGTAGGSSTSSSSTSSQTDSSDDVKENKYVICRDANGNGITIDVAGHTRYDDSVPDKIDRDYAAEAIAKINGITREDSVFLSNHINVPYLTTTYPNISQNDLDQIVKAASDRKSAIHSYNLKQLAADLQAQKILDDVRAAEKAERSAEFKKRDAFSISCDKYKTYDQDTTKAGKPTLLTSDNPRTQAILNWKKKHHVQEVVDSGFLNMLESTTLHGNDFGYDICFIGNPHLSAKNPFAKEKDGDARFMGRSCEIVVAVDITHRMNESDRFVKAGIITNETVIEIDGRKYQPIGIYKNPFINDSMSAEEQELYSQFGKKLANIVYETVMVGAEGASDEGSIQAQYQRDLDNNAVIPEDGKWYVARKNKSISLNDNGDVIVTGISYIMPGRSMRSAKWHSLRDVINGIVYKNEGGAGDGAYVGDWRLDIKRAGQGDTLPGEFHDGAVGIVYIDPAGQECVEYIRVAALKEYDFKLNDNTHVVMEMKSLFETIVNPESDELSKTEACAALNKMIWCPDAPIKVSGNSVVVNGKECNTIDEFIHECSESNFKFSVTSENMRNMYNSNVLLTDMTTFANKGASFAITGVQMRDASPFTYRINKSIQFTPGSGFIGTPDRLVVFGNHNYGIDNEGNVYRIEGKDHNYDVTPKESNTAKAVAYINGMPLEDVKGATCPFRLNGDKRETNWLVKMKVGGDIIHLHIRETGRDVTDKDGNFIMSGRRVTFVVGSEDAWNNLVKKAESAGNTWEDEVMRAKQQDFLGNDVNLAYGEYDAEDNFFIDDALREGAKKETREQYSDATLEELLSPEKHKAKSAKQYKESVEGAKSAVQAAEGKASDAQSRIEDIYKRFTEQRLDIEDIDKVMDKLNITERELDELCKYIRMIKSEKRKKQSLEDETQSIIEYENEINC